MARRTRAVAYAAAGKHDLAIADMRALEKAGQLMPEDAVVLGDNLRFAGQFEEAARVLNAPRAGRPEIPAAAASRSPKCRLRSARYPDAEATLERRAEARARLHRSAATARRSRVPARGHGRRRIALRPHPRARCHRCAGNDQARRRAHADRAGGRGHSPVPVGNRARSEKRRGAAVSRGCAGVERALARGAARTSSAPWPPTHDRRWR